jgi:CheY-like chemotaxis protein/HPt (histidine-containing phosphotransfer) domain-containing protein
LAEDDDFNQEIAAELLSQRGYQLTAATNGQDALIELLSKPTDFYCLILMDIEMPLMDGYQATEEIRKNYSFQHIPIVALTAHQSEATKIRCLQVGMQDFIGKPFNPELLYNTLEKWINKEQGNTSELANAGNCQENQNQHLPRMKNIDTERGLQLSGNNLQLYMQLLKRFVQSQPQTVKQLTTASTSDIATENFKRLIHTTKSICATLGASNLASRLDELENLLRSPTDSQHVRNISKLIDPIAFALEQTIIETHAFLISHEKTSGGTAPGQHAMTNLHSFSEQFIVLLQEADNESIDFFHQNKAGLANILDASILAAISDALNEYDFDKAIHLIANAKLINSANNADKEAN